MPYDLTNWTANHVWLHKQPVTLWLIASSLKIFGANTLAVRMPSVILTTIGIKLIYDIAKFFYNAKVAIIAAFLFSIHGLIIELATGRQATDHVDAIFLFFVLCSVWGSVQYMKHRREGYSLLIGICLGLAILTKWLPALLVLLLWLLLVNGTITKSKMLLNFVLISAVTCIVCLPWQLYIMKYYPAEAAWEYLFTRRHFYEALEGQSGPGLFHLDKMRIEYGELVYLPVLWFIYRAIKERKKYDLIVMAWLVVPYTFFSLAATKMDGYVIISAPAIFIITGEAVVAFTQPARHLRPMYKRLMHLVAFGLVALPVRYTLERVSHSMKNQNHRGLS